MRDPYAVADSLNLAPIRVPLNRLVKIGFVYLTVLLEEGELVYLYLGAANGHPLERPDYFGSNPSLNKRIARGAKAARLILDVSATSQPDLFGRESRLIHLLGAYDGPNWFNRSSGLLRITSDDDIAAMPLNTRRSVAGLTGLLVVKQRTHRAAFYSHASLNGQRHWKVLGHAPDMTLEEATVAYRRFIRGETLDA